MPPKKIAIAKKPMTETVVDPTDWVTTRNSSEIQSPVSSDIQSTDKIPERMKRITFQVTESRHQAIKILAAQRGMTITEIMHALLEKELDTNKEL